MGAPILKMEKGESLSHFLKRAIAKVEDVPIEAVTAEYIKRKNKTDRKKQSSSENLTPSF